ncbi:MAG: hypothetical protein LUC86_08485 [Prevotellaceae bacterium]|nr:hypothetical protein [Prevotellaceae bacterium]
MAEGLDTSNMKVSAISSDLATSIDTQKWYLLEQKRTSESVWTPIYDEGEGETVDRASTADAIMAWGDGVVGSYGSDLAKYLLHFVETSGATPLYSSSTVYYLQFATGNYFASAEYGQQTYVSTTSSLESAGLWDVATIGENAGHWAIYANNTGYALNNDGAGKGVDTWATGEVTTTGGNDDWELYEVTLEDMTESDYNLAELTELIEEAQATYDANDAVGVALITSADQLSSNLTQDGDGDGLPALIDGDASTYWQSTWSGVTVTDGDAYIEIALPEDYTGGDVELSITRRNQNNNQISEILVVSVDGETETTITTLDIPFESPGETVAVDFTIPEGTTVIRLYEEATTAVDLTSGQYNAGNWHLAELQLYDLTVASVNEQYAEEAAALAAAIEAAQTALEGTVSASDIETLQAALDAYNAAISGEESEEEGETFTIHSCVADIDHWTTTGNNGTHEQNTWSVETDESGMVTPFCQNWVYGTLLTDATISHEQLTGLEAGDYTVSLDIRIFSEQGAESINTGTTLTANEASVDIAETGTFETYGTETGVYGTFSLTATVGEEGTLDIAINVSDANYNWIAWKNLTVTSSIAPTLTAVEGKMNATVQETMETALAAYESDPSQDTYEAAFAAIEAAETSAAYYAGIAEVVDSLDEAGANVWEATEDGAAYSACTLTDEDVSASLIAAQKAQTTDGSDLTYTILNDGTWAAAQGNGPGLCPSRDTAHETYNTADYAEGDILSCTISGLQPGTYEISFYAQSNAANIEGLTYGDDIAEAYANDTVKAIAVGTATSCVYTEDDIVTLTVTVDSIGTLTYGVLNIAAGGNWVTMEPVSLTYLSPVATAIEGLKAEASANSEAVYTLQGIRVSKPTKGIYIKGGKKIVVK